MQPGRLNTLAVKRAKAPGRYSDGGNLYLFVKRSGGRLWTFRYKVPGGSQREMSLGAEIDVTLAEAREKARDARRLIASGLDPITARQTAKREAFGNVTTFRDVADLYIEAHRDGWRNPKHRAQWSSTLDTYAHPILGDLPVGNVDVAEIMKVLEPVWKAKPETASRLRGRVEAILDYATARGWRQGDNPARWKGHLANLLAKRSKLAPVQHHAALPWREAPAFVQGLKSQVGMAALALQFTILTAARTSEVTGATWGEIDVEAKVWTVPAARMKSARAHRVALSASALAILHGLHRPSVQAGTHVFVGGRGDAGLSNMSMTALLRRMKRGDLTVHGFRSTFRDWAAEATPYPREVAEAALAHTLRDKVESAYRRSDLLERRAELMADWAAYLARSPATGSEVQADDPQTSTAI